MKATKIILYIVIAAVVYYLIYKAYTNYQISGSIFSPYAEVLNPNEDVVVYDTTSTQRISPFVATDGRVMNGNNH